MKKRELRELLNRRTDAIMNEANLSPGRIEWELEEETQIQPLIELAAMLKNTLVPIQNPSLRPRLRKSLEAYSQPVVLLRPASEIPIYWIVLGVVGSAISLISVILFMVRRYRLFNRQSLGSPGRVV